MKNLKTFEAFDPMERTNLPEDYAKDLLPRLIAIKDEQGKFTEKDFFKYAKEKGIPDKEVDATFHYIVDKGYDLGFSFDMEDEDDEEDYEEGEIYLKQ